MAVVIRASPPPAPFDNDTSADWDTPSLHTRTPIRFVAATTTTSSTPRRTGNPLRDWSTTAYPNHSSAQSKWSLSGTSADTAVVVVDSDDDDDDDASVNAACRFACPKCGVNLDPPTLAALRSHVKAAGTAHDIPHASSSTSPLVPPIQYGLKPSNQGWKMLQRSGWQEGTSLGVDASAIKVPLRAHVKPDRAGLGMSQFLAEQRDVAKRRRLPNDVNQHIASTLSSSTLFKKRKQPQHDSVTNTSAKQYRMKHEEDTAKSRALLAYLNA